MNTLRPETESETPPVKQYRSAEELAMREQVDAWGRKRWPGARVVHELVVGQCRIDMAFICPTDLIGVEIKSSVDTLDRIENQYRTFWTHLPEVWIALAPKWDERRTKLVAKGQSYHHFRNEFTVTPDRVEVPKWMDKGYRDELCTSRMLELLWADEARAIAQRKQVWPGAIGAKVPRTKTLPMLARLLTGNEIVSEVCRELRARHQGRMGVAFWRADPPIFVEIEKRAN